MMTEEQVRREFLETGALLQGHFELRSGLHSDQFFQCARVLQYPVRTARLCAELAARWQAGAGQAVQTVIAPAMGGLFVGHEVARALRVRSIFAEKENGALTLRRGFSIAPGEELLVAEDVITRGGRVQETLDIIRRAGGVARGVVVLVDRSGGAARFDVPVLSLLRAAPVTWPPGDCPLCAAGSKPEHPGS